MTAAVVRNMSTNSLLPPDSIARLWCYSLFARNATAINVVIAIGHRHIRIYFDAGLRWRNTLLGWNREGRMATITQTKHIEYYFQCLESHFKHPDLTDRTSRSSSNESVESVTHALQLTLTHYQHSTMDVEINCISAPHTHTHTGTRSIRILFEKSMNRKQCATHL